MSRKHKLVAGAAITIAVLVLLASYISHHNVALLQPRGTIGIQEKRLIIIAVSLSMIVVIPVYFMLFSFAWRYREGNHKANYQPNLDGSRLYETIWWGVPLTIILILGIITYRSSVNLDPFKPINSSTPPMTIQVVAVQWKWVFIYPQQNIASVNWVMFPVNTPVDFKITSDAPMNSFWIPQLGGQIYAMSGMQTDLHLMANQAGTYRGSSANVSGAGFASMNFLAIAAKNSEFNNWVNNMQHGANKLGVEQYKKLAQPNSQLMPYQYSSVQNGLFDTILAKYQAPVYFQPETRQ